MKAKSAGQGEERVAEAEKRLVEELKALRKALRDGSRSGQKDGALADEDWIAIATLLPGLSNRRWQQIARELGLDSWFAVPCKGADYPLLRGLLSRVQELAHESRHDSLTGLLNRRGFEQLLEVEMERSRRFGTLLGLAILDIDDFKQVNDCYGHPCGDRVLTELAEVLKVHTRKINFQARLGGEEFAILAPGNSHLQTQAMLVRLQGQFRKREFRWSKEAFSLTFSAGVACYDGNPEVSAQQFVEWADGALYTAKRQGKDQTVCAPCDAKPGRGTQVSPQERELLLASKRHKKR